MPIFKDPKRKAPARRLFHPCPVICWEDQQKKGIIWQHKSCVQQKVEHAPRSRISPLLKYHGFYNFMEHDWWYLVITYDVRLILVQANIRKPPLLTSAMPWYRTASAEVCVLLITSDLGKFCMPPIKAQEHYDLSRLYHKRLIKGEKGYSSYPSLQLLTIYDNLIMLKLITTIPTSLCCDLLWLDMARYQAWLSFQRSETGNSRGRIYLARCCVRSLENHAPRRGKVATITLVHLPLATEVTRDI